MRASLNVVRALLSILALVVIALPGCAVQISSDRSNAAALGTAIVVGVMAADTVRYYRIGPDGKTPLYGVPEPDPARKINVQDCSKPIDRDAGNLMCN